MASLCKNHWGYTSFYHNQAGRPTTSYRKLYLLLDEGSLTFCADGNTVRLSFFKFLFK